MPFRYSFRSRSALTLYRNVIRMEDRCKAQCAHLILRWVLRSTLITTKSALVVVIKNPFKLERLLTYILTNSQDTRSKIVAGCECRSG